ncbi:MAG: nucleotide sugar dehydrogenase [Candidatus Saganbacteria bacterium]|nr:nucleotide sugar dehydrogenase [Candidatus Saganbacteria bacterium]
MKKICVLGLGYIGLPTASMFATSGFDVVGVDINKEIVANLQKGNIHIEEPDLNTLVSAALNSKRLLVKEAPETADVFIIAVPTPFNKDKSADLRHVVSAADSIVPYLKKNNLVILESTIPPGTTKEVLVPALEKSGLAAGQDFFVTHSPERILPGRALYELVQNDRVIGGINAESSKAAESLYKSFVKGNIYLTDSSTAEMVKLIENTYRDVNIALANELALISKNIGINVWEAIELANKHPRVNIHKPGPGVGGHCIAVDPWFIVAKDPKNSRLIQKAREINNNMPGQVVLMVKSFYPSLKDRVISVFGITYKGNIDDIRESPANFVIDGLLKEGARVKIFDPHVKSHPVYKSLLTGLDESVQGSDCIIILSDHNEFVGLDPGSISKLVKQKVVLDTKNCLDHSRWLKEGFSVSLLGYLK